jgi:hypothetical protein
MIEAVSVGKLSNVTVELEGSTAERGWYLEKIIIRDMTHADSYRVFPCRQ